METTLNIDGYTVEIKYDNWAENPRSSGYTSCLCMTDPDYLFGGELLLQKGRSMEEVFIEHLSEKGLSRAGVIVEPLYLYVHSGVALRANCPMLKGFIEDGSMRCAVRLPKNLACKISVLSLK